MNEFIKEKKESMNKYDPANLGKYYNRKDATSKVKPFQLVDYHFSNRAIVLQVPNTGTRWAIPLEQFEKDWEEVMYVGVATNTMKDNDPVNHPSHYGGDTTYEAIKVIEAWKLGFNLGNTVKYICRANKKGDLISNLKKAAWYLEREISNLQNNVAPDWDKDVKEDNSIMPINTTRDEIS